MTSYSVSYGELVFALGAESIFVTLETLIFFCKERQHRKNLKIASN